MRADGTSRRTTTKTRNVAALSRNRNVNVPGWSVRAIAPATSPPSAMPRFIVMRCCAKALWRRPGGVSELSKVDWLGQNEPLPAPTRMFNGNACHGAWISGKRAKHGGHHERAAQHRAWPDPVGERAADEPGASAGRDHGHDQAGNAERDPADVVQVDDQERPDDAVAEHVREPAPCRTQTSRGS